jgi:hypothetical protein
MRKRDLLILALGTGLMPLGARARAQGIWHKYLMRGQIVAKAGALVTVCVGRADGAQVGQTLTVVRFKQRGGPGKGAPPLIVRQDVGEVRIEAIVDEHFATGAIVSGRAQTRDMVELRAG